MSIETRLQSLERSAPASCPVCNDAGGVWPVELIDAGEEPVNTVCPACGLGPFPGSGIRRIIIARHEMQPAVAEPAPIVSARPAAALQPAPAQEPPAPSRDIPNKPPGRISHVFRNMTSPN